MKNGFSMSSFLDVYPVLHWGYCKSLFCNSKIEFLWFHELSNFHIHLVLYHQKNNLEILWFSHFVLSLFSYNFPCSGEYLFFTQLGPKKQCLWPKINCGQMKALYFANSSTDWLPKSEFSKSKILNLESFWFFLSIQKHI